MQCVIALVLALLVVTPAAAQQVDIKKPAPTPTRERGRRARRDRAGLCLARSARSRPTTSLARRACAVSAGLHPRVSPRRRRSHRIAGWTAPSVRWAARRPAGSSTTAGSRSASPRPGRPLRFPRAPLPERMTAPRWPGGARAACAFTFDLDAETLWMARGVSEAVALSQGRFGPVEALPRILNSSAPWRSAPRSSSPPGGGALSRCARRDRRGRSRVGCTATSTSA